MSTRTLQEYEVDSIIDVLHESYNALSESADDDLLDAIDDAIVLLGGESPASDHYDVADDEDADEDDDMQDHDEDFL